MTTRDEVLDWLTERGGIYRIDGKCLPVMAHELGTSLSSIRQMIGQLRDKGLLDVEASRGFGTVRIGLRNPLADMPPAAPTTNGHKPSPAPMPTSAADFGVAQMQMVWRNRVPAATLSVIAGAPGLGKSTLEAQIAADLSREGLIGIVSNMEDDPESVTVPRLRAAGADLSKVLIVRPENAPVLPAGFDQLVHMVESTGAKFVVLDPIVAHFRPERRVHDRGVLAALMALARRTECGIVGIHHTTKSGRQNQAASAIEAIGGPQGGLSGAARAVYLYGHDPEDEDRRALACVKMNGLDRPPTLIIEHETVEVHVEGVGMCEAGKLVFVEESNADAVDVLHKGARKRDRDAECVEWLTLFLATGEGCTRQPGEVRERGRGTGFGWQSILRASVTIGIEKGHVGFGKDQLWYWRLPDEHPMRRTKDRLGEGPPA